jgi:hypothetical protein
MKGDMANVRKMGGLRDKWVHFKFSLLLLLVVAFGGGFFHFCLDTKVEQKIKAA